MLSLLIVLLVIRGHSCTPLCDNYFPKIIGGMSDHTYVIDFDANHDTIYTCGRTHDSGLSGYSLYSGTCCYYYYVPIVAASDIDSNEMKWGFTDQS